MQLSQESYNIFCHLIPTQSVSVFGSFLFYCITAAFVDVYISLKYVHMNQTWKTVWSSSGSFVPRISVSDICCSQDLQREQGKGEVVMTVYPETRRQPAAAETLMESLCSNLRRTCEEIDFFQKAIGWIFHQDHLQNMKTGHTWSRWLSLWLFLPMPPFRGRSYHSLCLIYIWIKSHLLAV